MTKIEKSKRWVLLQHHIETNRNYSNLFPKSNWGRRKSHTGLTHCAATNCVWLPLTQSGQANSQNDVNQWIQDPTDWSMIMFCYNTSPDDVSFAILTSVCQKRVYVWTSCKRWWNVSLSILQLNFPLPVPQVEICKCVSVLSILAEETNTHSTKLTLEPFFTIISREIRPQHLTMSS